MIFPADDKARKMLPVFAMITRYFPKAMREITKVCVANNVRYNPGHDPADINWARGKSPDQLGMLSAICWSARWMAQCSRNCRLSWLPWCNSIESMSWRRPPGGFVRP